jgi:hypothetical protein
MEQRAGVLLVPRTGTAAFVGLSRRPSGRVVQVVAHVT